MRSSTMAREHAEHFCPWNPNAACATPSTAESISASASTMIGVFAAHFENGALDPELAGSLRRRDFVDVQSDFARSSERDIARLRMRDYRIAEAGTRSRDRNSRRLRACRLLRAAP